jgi:hypothetical protein
LYVLQTACDPAGGFLKTFTSFGDCALPLPSFEAGQLRAMNSAHENQSK